MSRSYKERRVADFLRLFLFSESWSGIFFWRIVGVCLCSRGLPLWYLNPASRWKPSGIAVRKPWLDSTGGHQRNMGEMVGALSGPSWIEIVRCNLMFPPFNRNSVLQGVREMPSELENGNEYWKKDKISKIYTSGEAANFYVRWFLRLITASVNRWHSIHCPVYF